MFARSLFDEYVDAPADLFNYLNRLQFTLHRRKLIGSGQEKVQGLKLDGDRSIDCGSYEYLCGVPNRVRAVGYGALAILIFSPIIVSTGRLAAVCGDPVVAPKLKSSRKTSRSQN